MHCARSLRRQPWFAAAVSVALLIGGCGFGPGAGSKNASVSVTRDFGSVAIGSYYQRRVPGSETVMALLQRHFEIDARYGGGFVQSIDGHSGDGPHQDWFYFVNGMLASNGAAATAVHGGDHVWWDLHDWSATDTVPAVVGSYPEPFVNGIGGRMLPTVLECAPDAQHACDTVADSLRRAGVKPGDQLLGGGSGSDSLAVLVGTWRDLHGVIATQLIDGGPANSGVYAQFVGAGGEAIELDNPRGRAVQTLRGSAGLVAATDQPSMNAPAWLVTGTDLAGVEAAAAAMTPSTLRDHFAVAISAGHVIPLPVDPTG